MTVTALELTGKTVEMAHLASDASLYGLMGKPQWLVAAEHAHALDGLFPVIVGLMTVNTILDLIRLRNLNKQLNEKTGSVTLCGEEINSSPCGGSLQEEIHQTKIRLAFSALANAAAITALAFHFSGVAALGALTPYVFVGAMSLMVVYNLYQMKCNIAKSFESGLTDDDDRAAYRQEAFKNFVRISLLALSITAVVVVMITPVGQLATVAFGVAALSVSLMAWAALRHMRANGSEITFAQHLKDFSIFRKGIYSRKPACTSSVQSTPQN